MNLRSPKVIRLCGWGALIATVLAVAAGAFLAFTFFESGNVLNAGIAGGITFATAALGGLLTYGAFLFAAMQPDQAIAPPSAAAMAPAEADVESAEPVALPSIVTPPSAPSLPPELSDDAIPVFDAHIAFATDESDSDEPAADQLEAADRFEEDLLVVPPPMTLVEESDRFVAASVATQDDSDDFDSRTDLPVTIDAIDPECQPEASDDIDSPAIVLESPTVAVTSAQTQTAEVDTVDDEPVIAASTSTATPAPPLSPAVTIHAPAPSPAQAFPDIFKSAPLKAAEVVRPTAPVAAPVPARPAPVVERPPVVEKKVVAPPPPPALPQPQPVESLPAAAELPEMAATLTPTAPAGGMLPTEIPDFFLKMPTGRPAPTARPAPPVAPVAPRQVAPPKPAPAAPSAVRIVDSTTINNEAENDLVTMTSIPDDWPS